MPVAARSDEHGSRLRPFPGARLLRRDRWTAGGHQPPTAYLAVVKVSNDRMRGRQSSSCKISLMFCGDLRADGVRLTGAHKADLSAVNVVAQTSMLRSSNTKGVLMAD